MPLSSVTFSPPLSLCPHLFFLSLSSSITPSFFIWSAHPRHLRAQSINTWLWIMSRPAWLTPDAPAGFKRSEIIKTLGAPLLLCRSYRTTYKLQTDPEADEYEGMHPQASRLWWQAGGLSLKQISTYLWVAPDFKMVASSSNKSSAWARATYRTSLNLEGTGGERLSHFLGLSHRLEALRFVALYGVQVLDQSIKWIILVVPWILNFLSKSQAG